MKYKVGDRVKLNDVIYDECGFVEESLRELFGGVVLIEGIYTRCMPYPYLFTYRGCNVWVGDRDILGKVEDDNKVVKQ